MPPSTDTPEFDAVSQIMAYEADGLDDEATVVLFQHLVDTGEAWTLQGHYGKIATQLIAAGLVTRPRSPGEFPSVAPRGLLS